MSLPTSRSIDEQWPRHGGGVLAVRRWQGALPPDQGAWVLHLHGGAFVGGSLDSGAVVARLLASQAATVVALDYPLAPAHPFPQALEAGHDALMQLDRERRRHGPDAPLLVAGEEAGGNLAAALAHIARDRGEPVLAGQILMSPMLDACIATASQRDARDGPRGCPCAEGWRAYLAEVRDAAHPYASPATSLRLRQLAPALLLTARDDPLRDETLAYAARLRAAGVPVQALTLGLPTGWPRAYADADAAWEAPVRRAIGEFIASATRAGAVPPALA